MADADEKGRRSGKISDRFPASAPLDRNRGTTPKPLEVRDGQVQPSEQPEPVATKPSAPLSTIFFGSERPFADYVLIHFQDLVPSLPGSGGDGKALDRARLRQSLAQVMEDLENEPQLRMQPDFASQLALIRQFPDEFLDVVIEGTLGFGPLEPLLKDPTIREIMANGPTDIFVEKVGRVERVRTRFRDEQHMLDVIGRILSPLGKRVDFACPMADARMPDGSRINVIIPPLSLDGPAITIRRTSEKTLTVADLVRLGALTQPMADFLGACVQARLSLIISGGTGSGKTTLLNVLSSFIPDHERIILIEDTSEIRISKPNRLRLEARTSNIEGAGEVTIRDLVRNALRMRPDRILVGECRGGEALDMLQAMNTGHEGSMTTVHANSPRDLLSRLEVMVLMSGMLLPIPAIQRQIAGAIHLIVQVDRLDDGKRRVTRITEVEGFSDGVCAISDLFEFQLEGYDESGNTRGRFTPTGIRPRCLDKLARLGIEFSPDMFRAE